MEAGHINTNIKSQRNINLKGKCLHWQDLRLPILTVSTMSSGLIIDTPTNGLMTTSLIFLNCPLSIYGRDFGVDLICLPLSDIYVILGMSWLEFNHVHINCYNKLVRFLSPKEEEEVCFISASQLEELLKDEAKVLAMYASLSVESQILVEGLPVICEFPKVFPDDISNLPLEREIEFATDLVSGTRPVSLAAYKMST
ncbi:uncharacterized protein LOC127080192 [Lathyrus oleraceus]|uniref:uncharacterized protein LOC127080192 n=1 Tax=Pisum sativum TaxID=3888 RepID=UPI0021D322E9|nr:uncharacterized protein LOC127080192 [Pisum sativum]